MAGQTVTDDNHEEPPMKLAIDNEKLGAAIDRKEDGMTRHGDQIITRANQRLHHEVDRKVELQASLAEDEAQLVQLRDQRSRLDALIAKGEANTKDARIELKAVLASINLMEMEGLSL